MKKEKQTFKYGLVIGFIRTLYSIHLSLFINTLLGLSHKEVVNSLQYYFIEAMCFLENDF